MLNWILPAGWIMLLLSGENATCKDSDGNIIVVDVMGV